MPYIVAFIQQANQVFDPPGVIDSDGLLQALEGVDTVLEGIARFELLGAIEDDEIRRLAQEFIQLLPPSLDAAVLAVLRSALSRGLKTQFTWKPNYAFGLDLWESSKFDEEKGVWVGLVNVLILSPDPIEEAEAGYREPGTMGATGALTRPDGSPTRPPEGGVDAEPDEALVRGSDRRAPRRRHLARAAGR